MGTLVEEIFSHRLERRVAAGDIVIAEVDSIMSHDNTTPLAIEAWQKIGKPIKYPDRIVIHFDHAYPAPNIAAAINQRRALDFIREHELENFFHRGICHQVMIEEGFVAPGRIIIGADSHTNTYGAFGCFAAGFGSTEIGVAWATGKTWFRIPETIHVRLSGSLAPGVFAKDVMLETARVLGMDGATYAAVEYSGPLIESLPMHERIIFANMSTELGAKCGLIGVDDTTIEFLESQTQARGPFPRLQARQPSYRQEVAIDVTELEPQVACHPRVDRVKPLSELEGMAIDQVFIGTCTNARYEDLAIAARIFEGRKVAKHTRVIITPASQRVLDQIIAEGLVQIFHDAGCVVTSSGCGACIGRHGGVLAPGEKAFTTMNRNFVGRMGSPEAEIYLGSPAAAAATAIEGRIADPRKYLE